MIIITHAVDCNITSWTEWSCCCNGEKRRTRNAIRDDQCKAVSEGEECNEDNCSGHLTQCYIKYIYYESKFNAGT